MAFCPALLWKINGRENLKALIYVCLVLIFEPGEALHVGLAETEEDPEVRVLGERIRGEQQQTA
jgi:hypothetical protein